MIKINVAIFAEQVVSAAESDCPRRSFNTRTNYNKGDCR